MQIIDDWNNLNPNKRWILSKDRIHGSFTPEYISSVMIRDNPGTLVRALVPMEENVTLSAEILTELRKQASALACFLMNHL